MKECGSGMNAKRVPLALQVPVGLLETDPGGRNTFFGIQIRYIFGKEVCATLKASNSELLATLLKMYGDAILLKEYVGSVSDELYLKGQYRFS